MPQADIKKIIGDNKALGSTKSNWDNYHQELANFCLSRKAHITTPLISGDRLQYNFLYDMTATRAVKKFTAGFDSNLTNASTQWHGLTLFDQNRMSKNLEIYFRDATDIMFSVRRRTNFSNVIKEAYASYAVFGTAPVLSLSDPKEKIVYTNITLDGLHLEEDMNGRVIGVYRNFTMTAIQAEANWPGKTGKTIMDLAKDKPHEKVKILHYVGPRNRRDLYKLDNENMPFESVWIAKKDSHLINELGFESNPYHVGRFWKENGEPFGYSPAMDVLADIKLMNACLKTWLRRAMKEADPPILIPDKGFALPLNLNPTGVNYRKESLGKGSMEQVGVGGGSFSISREFIEYIQRNINEGFYLDVFQSFNLITKQMPVIEVQQRIREGMVLLGPVVNQVEHELLDPLILRDFFMLLDQGILPPPPDELFDNEFGPVYESPLARAAKESELKQVDNLLGRGAQMAAVLGEQILDPIDGDVILRDTAKVLGVNPKFFKDDADVAAAREGRAKIAEAQAGMEAAHKVAAIQETGSRAIKNAGEPVAA